MNETEVGNVLVRGKGLTGSFSGAGSSGDSDHVDFMGASVFVKDS